MSMNALNIMVADDSATSRTYVLKNLQVANIPMAEFIQVANGKEALDVILVKPVDLLFLDINMPVMTGVELAEELAKRKLLQKIRVVVISSDGSAQRAEHLQSLGVRKFIRKPFTPELFSGLISELFGTEGLK